jgi:hypothetical protein
MRIMKRYSIASVLVALLSLAAASPSHSEEWLGKPFDSNASAAEKWINESCTPSDLQGIQTTFARGYGSTSSSYSLFVLCRPDGSADVQYKVDTVPLSKEVDIKGNIKLIGRFPLGGGDDLLYIEKVK